MQNILCCQLLLAKMFLVVKRIKYLFNQGGTIVFKNYYICKTDKRAIRVTKTATVGIRKGAYVIFTSNGMQSGL